MFIYYIEVIMDCHEIRSTMNENLATIW